MFGISGEADDDGEAATNHQPQNRTYQQRQQSSRQAAPRQQRQQAASQPPQPSPEEQQQIDGLKTEYRNVLNGLVKQGAQKKEINNEVNNRLKRSIKDFTKKDELSKWTDALAMIQKIANERTQNLFEEVPEANAQ